MCITEYNEAETMNGFKQEGIEEGRAEGRVEGRAEGRAEGREEGTIKTLLGLVKKGLLTEANAAAEANVSVAEFKKLAAQYS